MHDIIDGNHVILYLPRSHQGLACGLPAVLVSHHDAPLPAEKSRHHNHQKQLAATWNLLKRTSPGVLQPIASSMATPRQASLIIPS